MYRPQTTLVQHFLRLLSQGFTSFVPPSLLSLPAVLRRVLHSPIFPLNAQSLRVATLKRDISRGTRNKRNSCSKRKLTPLFCLHPPDPREEMCISENVPTTPLFPMRNEELHCERGLNINAKAGGTVYIHSNRVY